MTDFRKAIQDLIQTGKVRVSDHGYDEIAEDGLTARELVSGIGEAIPVEEHPDYVKGPCILLLQKDRQGKPVHVVWDVPRGYDEPAVLITAYRPDPDRWDEAFLKRTSS